MSKQDDNLSSAGSDHCSSDCGIPMDISKILPQKYPFLFIDKIVSVDKNNQTITCLKNVSANESFFHGHFPGNPVLPGVIIVEAMAQASILLYAAVKPQNAAKNPVYYLGKIEASFKKPVVPGDVLVLKADCVKIIDTGGIVKVTAKVGKELSAEATLNFGVKLFNT